MTLHEESKGSIRAHYRAERGALSLERRREAEGALVGRLEERLRRVEGLVLSFSSWREEIEMGQINRQLAREGRLVLPRVDGEELLLCQVANPDSDLKVSQWGIAEPDPSRSSCIAASEVAVALVPGLVFDRFGHRLGYGRGYYDRLLPRMPQALSVGVGFREQLAAKPLPVSGHDMVLAELILV